MAWVKLESLLMMVAVTACGTGGTAPVDASIDSSPTPCTFAADAWNCGAFLGAFVDCGEGGACGLEGGASCFTCAPDGGEICVCYTNPIGQQGVSCVASSATCVF